MKATMLCNMVIKSVFAVCVTVAAIHFNNAWILWWYILLAFLGYDYCKETPIEKGATDERN